MITYAGIRAVKALGEAGAREAEAQKAELELRREEKQAEVLRVEVPRPAPVQLYEPSLSMNTHQVLDMTRDLLAWFARWDNPYWLDIAALWAASTWFVESPKDGGLLFKAHPRLIAIAPPGSGKTRMMEIVQALSRDPTVIGQPWVTTSYGLRDAFNAGKTVFLDEVDRIVGRGSANQGIQAMISAYKGSAGSINGQGGLNQQNSFGPMMIAAKPRLITGTNGFVEDLLERGFILTPSKSRDEIPDLDGKFTEATHLVSELLKIWGANTNPDEGQDALWPVHAVPKALDSRMREISQPLLAVADRAVDPQYPVDHEGQPDLYWANRAREAVQNVLLGHGSNGPELLEDTRSQLKKMGIKLS